MPGLNAAAARAAKVVAEILASGGAAVADTNNIASAAGGEALIQTAVDTFGRVDIVVNNAGILRDKSFVKMEPALWDPVVQVHLSGAMNVTRPAWEHMRAQAYGRVVMTSSGSGLFGNFGQSNYGAAKMGLVGLTRVLAQEGARHNIMVNAIAPVARTRMTETMFPAIADKLHPRLVSPVVAFLAAAECTVNGEICSVVGGRVARIFVGVTQGYYNAGLSVEDVVTHLDQIRDETGYAVPPSVEGEIALVTPLLAKARSPHREAISQGPAEGGHTA